MTMVDGSSNQVVDIPHELDETRFGGDATDNSLGQFLSRPIRIALIDWNTSGALNALLNPWDLFLSNSRVVNRIAAFKLLRGNLKIKILINGNSFFYGRMMVSYWPLHTWDSLTSSSALPQNNVQFSQMPRVMLDPTTSQGGEMTLPFFWHNDYLDITSGEKEDLGILAFRQLTALKHTSGRVDSDTRVAITVYAWMEDVQLEAPTNTNPFGIVPQSTKGTDYIAPYQFGTGSSVQNPDMHNFQPRGVSNMVLTDVNDTTSKMTISSKQEVTLDPRVLGLGPEDQMSIKHIASRESYLTSFNWLRDAVSDDLLFNMRVTPALFDIDASAAPVVPIYMTASCGAVIPFRYWRGSLKVRLQIVASAFHRGRLAVVYDPQSTSALRQDNTAYTHVIDIASCRDATFRIGMNQDRPFLQKRDPGSAGTSIPFSGSPLGVDVTGNGTLAIYVLNELAVPNPLPSINNDISINVFTSMDDDFDVIVPATGFSRFTIKPQSTGVVGDTSVVDPVEDSEPYSTVVHDLDQHIANPSQLHKVFAGETIANFRQLLKRYSPWAGFRLTASASSGYTQFNHRMFPAYRGYVPGAVHTTSTPTVNYNYFQTTLINYLAPAFQAWRGSIRYKMFPRASLVSPGRGITTVSETHDTSYNIVEHDFVATNQSTVARSMMFSGPFLAKSKGSLVFLQTVNPTVEYEIPWWETMRFCPGKQIDWTSASSSRDLVLKGANVCIDRSRTEFTYYDSHVSAGNDFSFYFFTGWPVMYNNLDPPL